jgi:hypothetical protein
MTYSPFTLLLLFSLFSVGAVAATLAVVPEGQVRFYNIADSDFDRYSKRPSESRQAFMRKHYERMQTYSPYFDERTSWYPNAWLYKDSYALKPHWEAFTAHPEWILRDMEGNGLYIPWGCKSGRCPQFAADLGNADFRTHWIDEARAALAHGYQGLWVDDVNLAWRVSNGDGEFVRPVSPRTGYGMDLTEWQQNFATFMEEIRAAFPDVEIAHNAIWYADRFDNPALLRQIDAADYINLERGASDPGLKGGSGRWSLDRFLSFIDLVHARQRGVILMDYGTSIQQRSYGLAAWFLISSGIDLMSSNQLNWTAPGHLWRGYQLNLGAARTERYRWRGLWRRDFDCGFVALNLTQARAVEFEIEPDIILINDEIAPRRVELGAAQAVVAERACASVTSD